MDLLEALKEKNNRLYTDCEKVKQLVEPILENRIHLDFTDHSIKHSERILQQLNEITDELMKSEDLLNEYEIFVLICAVYLHDIGMQFEKFDLLDSSFSNEISGDIASEEDKLNFIRKNHHRISKLWIIKSIQGNESYRRVYYGHDELGEYIALIAESHNLDISKKTEDYKDTYFFGVKIRLMLLACLLSLGDVLDGDSRRVDMERLKHINIDATSKLHWWKHYYVDGLFYDNGILNIQYNFPKLDEPRKSIYHDYFSYEMKYWIKYNKDKFKDVFAPNHIRFEINEIFKESIIKKELEQDDYRYIENYIMSGRVSELEKIRQAISKELGNENIKVCEYNECYIVKFKENSMTSILKSDFRKRDFQELIIEIINIIRG